MTGVTVTDLRAVAGVEQPSVEQLIAGGGAKWTRAPGALGASVAEMDFGLAPEVRDAVVRSAREHALGYLPPPLAAELAEACAELQWRAFGWAVRPEQVMPVGDVIVGLETVIENFTPPGSPVVVLTPAYMPFLTVPVRLGRPVVEVPLRPATTGSWELDLDLLDGALRGGAGLVVLCNPHNPLGKVYRDDELRDLAEIVDRHGVRVFADEIHSLLVHPGARHIPYASLDERTERHTVTATSASKSWNIPGLKCAQVVLAESDRSAWNGIRHSASRGVSNPGAAATIAAYRHGHAWLDAVRALLLQNRRLVVDLVARHLPDVATAPPEATYLAWLDCRAAGLGRRPAEFFLRHANVSLTDGALCGAAGAGFARLNFATPAPILDRIIRSMGRALDQR